MLRRDSGVRLVGACAALGLVTMGWVAPGSPQADTSPGPPTRVVATAWNASAIVTWRAPSSSGRSPITSYRVTARPGRIIAVFPGNQTWGQVSRLTNGVSYTFTVTAVDQAKKRSRPSETSNLVTPLWVEIRVRGNQLLNAAGQPLRLFGVNRSGAEYKCVVGGAGAGIFSGPTDAASIAAMASWHINAVRVPLNEHCWLGINGVNPAYGGANYQRAIATYVADLNAAGLVAILDLHWNAPGGTLAQKQQPMADADHAPAFWTSVAGYFKDNRGVIFDLYNEPRDVSWSCLRDGCRTKDSWATAGMQSLVDAVRQTGATQPIMVGGLEFANDLSSWLAYRVHDPLKQLIGSVHVYNSNRCRTVACWNGPLASVAAKVPVVTGEVGEFRGAPNFIATYMNWADGQRLRGQSVSYLAWAWDAAQGDGGPSLIASEDGTPTAYGLRFRAHLEKLFEQGRIYEG
jgi:Cellulase (glycosyl hydrolase family 5)/Fibronectin type III domain